MKKLLAGLGLFGLMLSLSVICKAGTPQETLFQNQFPFSNATVIGSTSSTTSAVNISKVVAAPSCANSASGRNCFTKFVIQIPTTTVISILDGATTSYTLYGLGLGASGVNTLNLPEDHLGPLCFTAGNTVTFNLINTAGTTVPQAFNYEGYTNCGGSNNAGQ